MPFAGVLIRRHIVTRRSHPRLAPGVRVRWAPAWGTLSPSTSVCFPALDFVPGYRTLFLLCSKLFFQMEDYLDTHEALNTSAGLGPV